MSSRWEITIPELSSLINSRFLEGLEGRDTLADSIRDPRNPDHLHPLLEHFIFSGTQELIDMFNDLDANDPVLTLPSLSRTKHLKDRVDQLPDLEMLNDPREFAFALVNAHHRMIEGQNNKRAAKSGVIITDEQKKRAIGTPSMSISDRVKAIGIALHLIERTMFAYFRNQDPELYKEWEKDEILFALEDMAQLRHAQITLWLRDDADAILFNLINLPNDQGGLDWRKPANLDEIAADLNRLLN